MMRRGQNQTSADRYLRRVQEPTGAALDGDEPGGGREPTEVEDIRRAGADDRMIVPRPHLDRRRCGVEPRQGQVGRSRDQDGVDTAAADEGVVLRLRAGDIEAVIA